MKTKPMYIDEINSVKGLIAKKAIESWRKLPPKTRCYIELEDMISEGVMKVYQLLSQGKYNPKKGKLTTLVYIRLENYYRRCAELLNTQKRFDGYDSYLEDLRSNGFDVQSMEEESETREHVRNVFLDVYTNASDGLRESLRRWFLQTEVTKIHTSGSRFLKAKSEFKTLATRYNLDVQDCRAIMYSVQIRNEIVSRLPEYKYIEVK